MKRSRAPYEAFIHRPRLRLPGDGRLAVHVIVNVEDWVLDGKLPRQILTAPLGAEPIPDVPNFAYYQYGMRVGIWRIFDVMRKHGVRVTMSLNASVCNSYRAIVDEAVRADWEMLGHGLFQRPMSMVEDERAVVRESLDVIERTTGRRPRGWLGPGLVETWETPEILVAEGITYCCDWGPCDDLPFPLEVASGSLLSVPYPIEMNDIVIFGLERRPDDAMLERGKRHFDCLYRESADQAKVMAIALHPWISGTPHRIGALDELLAYISAKPGTSFMNGGEIADWYAGAALSPAAR
ncbi:MAG: polysaccharide deacetylase family protein [Candidatus Velthaea sp.]